MDAADDILRRILPELSASMTETVSARVAIAWPALVGPALAGLTAPGRFDTATGLLEVEVEGPWRDALFRTRHLLIGRLRALHPSVRGVHLTTVPSGHLRPAAAARVTAPAPGPPPPPDPRSAGVADDDLRAALDGLCHAWDAERKPA